MYKIIIIWSISISLALLRIQHPIISFLSHIATKPPLESELAAPIYVYSQSFFTFRQYAVNCSIIFPQTPYTPQKNLILASLVENFSTQFTNPLIRHYVFSCYYNLVCELWLALSVFLCSFCSLLASCPFGALLWEWNVFFNLFRLRFFGLVMIAIILYSLACSLNR